MDQFATVKRGPSVIADHMERFESYMRSALRSDTALLNLVIRYIMKQRGKRVRPMLVFLSAGIAGGITHRTYVGALMVELLHTATLVHDDVVDQADLRRGVSSINAVWKNKVAVLVGDYLLSKGLLVAMNDNETGFLRITSDAVRRMSEGELLQIQKSRQKTLDETTYFKIISDKTASLISACCEAGAFSASASPDQQLLLKEFGEYVGLAFQIRDDVLDYTSRSSILGKPVAGDLRDQKITIPLIYAVKNAPSSEAKSILRLLKNKKPDDKTIEKILQFVTSYNGIECAMDKARDLHKMAIGHLQSFPDSEYRTAMSKFANFVVARDK